MEKKGSSISFNNQMVEKPPQAPFAEEDRLLTLQEVAHYLQLKPSTVRDMALKKEIPALFVRRRWRFKQKDLLQWLETSHRVK